MKAILICVAVTVLMTVSVRTYAQGKPRTFAEGLENRISMGCNSYAWSSSNLLAFAASRAGLQLHVAPDVLVNTQSGVSRDALITHFAFGDIEVRCLAAWALRFLEGHGQVRSGILHVNVPSDVVTDGDLRQVCREADAAWRESQQALLETPLPKVDIEEALDAASLIAFLAGRAGIMNYVFAPGAPAQNVRATFPQNARTYGAAINALCESAGLRYEFTGGLMFFENESETKVYNQTNGL